MIQFTCPKCQAQLKVGDEKAGKKGPCPQCGAAIEVPKAPAPAAAPVLKPGKNPDPYDLADESKGTAKATAAAKAPSAQTGLVTTSVQEITVVNFEKTSVLDATTIGAIGNELYGLVDTQARRKLLLDFTQVKFLSSQMLGVLINLHKKLAAIEGRVILCGLKPDLLKVFTIMKLDKILTIVESEREGLQLLGLRRNA